VISLADFKIYLLFLQQLLHFVGNCFYKQFRVRDSWFRPRFYVQVYARERACGVRGFARMHCNSHFKTLEIAVCAKHVCVNRDGKSRLVPSLYYKKSIRGILQDA